MAQIADYWEYMLAALIVLAVIILGFMIFRSLGGSIRGRRGGRLGISEYYEIDKSRRLVLVRRDGVEHLLLIGGSEDIVVESGIRQVASQETAGSYSYRPTPPPSSSASMMGDREPERSEPRVVRPIAPPRPAPRPAVFGEREPNVHSMERGEPRLTPVPAEPSNKDSI